MNIPALNSIDTGYLAKILATMARAGLALDENAKCEVRDDILAGIYVTVSGGWTVFCRRRDGAVMWKCPDGKVRKTCPWARKAISL
ncbi:MAG: hypothetical protein HQL75_00185 [Magnetococcales bacterium]|nr:hypothetical protein [Magnetococcales bacterium]